MGKEEKNFFGKRQSSLTRGKEGLGEGDSENASLLGVIFRRGGKKNFQNAQRERAVLVVFVGGGGGEGGGACHFETEQGKKKKRQFDYPRRLLAREKAAEEKGPFQEAGTVRPLGRGRKKERSFIFKEKNIRSLPVVKPSKKKKLKETELDIRNQKHSGNRLLGSRARIL